MRLLGDLTIGVVIRRGIGDRYLNTDWNTIDTAPATWAYFEVCRSVLVNKGTGDEPKRDFAMYVPTDPEPWKIKGGEPMTDNDFKRVYTHWRDATPLPPPQTSAV